MALIVRIAVLLGTLGLFKPQVDAYKASGVNRKDARYGRPVLAMANSPRCMFNGRPVEDGRTVSSPEPCLNCTCSKGILLCYLRTCSTVVATPGCDVVRRKGECCPKLECKGTTDYRADRTSETSYKYRLRQDESNFFGLIGLDPRTEKSNIYKTTTTTRKPAPKLHYNQDDWPPSNGNDPSSEYQSPFEQEEDYESDRLSGDRNDSSLYCYHKGYKYTEGMAMLSPTKCEYCYCIRGQQMCVRPKCHLNIDGCVARYQSGYTCCPSHYQCEVGAQGIETDRYQLTPSTKPEEPINKVSSCNVEGYDFDVGVAVPSSGNCQTCYCTQVGVVCRRLECSPTVPGCTPVVPEGHCCPTEYKCDQQGVNETQVPVSHSTENYDVTVISPSGTEDVSTRTTEAETIDDVNYDETDNPTTDSRDETSTSFTVPEKQKITVELNDESNLESISVIPEENIAVLVVTTEEASNQYIPSKDTEEPSTFQDTTKMELDAITPSYLKQKVKSSTARDSTTITDEIQYSQDSTKPIIISLPNLKQKTKPTTIKDSTFITHGTQYLQDTTKPSVIPVSSMKQKTSTAGDVSNQSEGIEYSHYATNPTIVSLPNLKQKIKFSTANVLSTTTKEDKIKESTPVLHPTQQSDFSTEATKYSTPDDSDYNGEDKDYAYDYVELYEDVTHGEHETFAPFSDYHEPTYGERITSTEKTRGTTNAVLKTKDKKPPALIESRNPITASTTLSNSKFATEELNTKDSTEETEIDLDSSTYSTIPVTETYKPTDNPTRYTIYSTTSEKSQKPYTTESNVRQKQKIKPNKPMHVNNTQYAPETLRRTTTASQISTRTYQNGEHNSASDQTSDDRYLIETYRPHSQPEREPTVIYSNHKQKPQKFSQTTLPYKSTKPLPQDIAELLWSITQNDNTEALATSTETYYPTTKLETFVSKLSDNSEYLPDSLSSLVVAAPKLIVEDTTAEESHGTLQFETTNSDTPTSGSLPPISGSPPGLIFKAPEIIFSNHGPTSHRKQPPPLRESGQQPVWEYGQPMRESGLQTVRKPGLQTVRLPGKHPVRESGLQTVRQPGQQPMRESGLQTNRQPGQQPMRESGLQTNRQPGQQPMHESGLQTNRQPGQQVMHEPGLQTNRQPGQQPVRDPSLQIVRQPGQQPVRDPGLQTVRQPGQQPVRDPGLQTVRQPGQQPVRDAGMQTVRQPGQQPVQDAGMQTVRQPGQEPVRDPGLQAIRQPGQQSVWEQDQQPYRQTGKQPIRIPSIPMEINNHKKTLRPRPPVRFRPPPTPSVPQTSVVEISNHRPTNSFRRPPGQFPPYPSYNQRSEVEYRRHQGNPRDSHHSLHRIAPDLHPEWREDYDEYYYDFEQGRSPSTKVLTNIQEHKTTGSDYQRNTDTNKEFPATNLQPTTRKHDLTSNPTTTNNVEDQEETKSTVEFTGETIKPTVFDNVEGRSSYDKQTETTTQTFPTTPYPTTKQTIITSTFSGNTQPENDVKLLRAEDNKKESETGFIDHRYGQNEGEPNKFEVINGRPHSPNPEKPILKPLSFLSETLSGQTVDSPTSEEDSKEINDVCFVDGRYYNSGEIIVKSNPCEMCRCFYGHPLCQVQQCPSPPEPSCVLEYLPGYCCPRVTCGVKMDSEPTDVSAPDPTSQEIRPPIITSDNQWKPLPHGPIVRPVESAPKVETAIPDKIPEVVTAPPQPIIVDEIKEDTGNRVELNVESSYAFDNSKERDEPISVSITPASTTTTESTIPDTTTQAAPTTSTTERIEITTYFPEITTEPPTTEPTPVFEPVTDDNSSEQNKSEIHDNSSGVRKVLNETVTLPPSKMSLSPTGGENISTVLPVIQTLPPTTTSTAIPDLELDTIANIVLSDLPAELGGNLKVSGCNVYGKYYKINDKVTVLSKKCSECICSTDGIACNATC